MAMVHIIGAGVSGLAAATQLSVAGVPVRLYEATAHAGGRARSYTDTALGMVDHGVHVINGDARELFAYLNRLGTRDSVVRITHPYRLPAMSIADYLGLLPLLFTRQVYVHAWLSADNRLWDTWLDRFSRAALHTESAQLSTRALRRALWQRLRRAPGSLRAFTVRDSLHASLIAPALAYLEDQGTSLYFNHALKNVEWRDGRISALVFAQQKIAVAADDVVILAAPAAVAQQLLSHRDAPTAPHAAITYHFKTPHREPLHRVDAPADAPVDLVRYSADRISVSLRVAGPVWLSDPEFLAERLWRWLQTRHPYLATQPRPPYASWREKNAGHRLLPNDRVKQPPLPERLFLAGDWLLPHAPSCLESAADSGHAAARAALALLHPDSRYRRRTLIERLSFLPARLEKTQHPPRFTGKR